MFERIRGLLVLVFGKLSLRYSSPPWLRSVGAGLGALLHRIRLPFRQAAGKGSPPAAATVPEATTVPEAATVPTHPGRFPPRLPLVIGAALVLVLLALGGLSLLRARPDQQDFSLNEPGRRDPGASNPPPLLVVFTGPVARLDLVGKELSSGITLAPPIEGTWKWADDRELLFLPKFDWPLGGRYKLEFSRELFAKEALLRRLSADFSTPDFSASIAESGLHVNPLEPGQIRARVRLDFTFPVDRTAFRAAVRSSAGLSVEFDDSSLSAFLVSAPLEIRDKAYEIELTVRGGYASTQGGRPFGRELQTKIRVPGRYDEARFDGAESSLLRTESYEYRRVLSVSASLDLEPEKLRAGLSAWVLPRDRAAAPGTPAEERHHWQLTEIDSKLLALSQPLALESVPIETRFGRAITFLYDAPSEREIYVRIAPDIEFAGSFRAKEGFEKVISLEAIPKELHIMYEGSILAMTGERTISLYANDVTDVMFEVGRIIPDQVNHLVTQTGGLFGSPNFQDWSFGLENISSIYSETRSLGPKDPGKVQYFSFDFNRYLERDTDSRLRYGLFNLRVSEYDRKTKAPTGVSSRRFILVTDLGILVKRNDQVGYDFFVQSVRTGAPVAGAEVEVIGKNGLSVFKEATDETGHAFIPRLDSFTREKTPVVFVVRKGTDMSFLPVEGRGRFLNYSRFDTGGVHGSADPGYIDAYLFSDRGLYRPGEEARFGIVVKAGDWKKALGGLPLEVCVEDPRGVEIQRRPLNLSSSGFEEFSWRSLDTASTGKYEVKLYLARDREAKRLLGSTSVKVEEFRPDRLSIRSRILEEEGLAWVSPGALHSEIKLMNLFGTPAAGNTVEGSFVLRPASPRIEGYPGFSFSDPYLADKSFEESLGRLVTDAEGKVTFPIDLGRFGKATYQLRVLAEGREKEGGRSVLTDSTILVSPLAAIVGYKADGDLSYVARKAARSLRFVAVDASRKQVALAGVRLKIDESRYVSVLEKGADNLYHYRSVEKLLTLVDRPFAIPAAGAVLDLPTDSAGNFQVALLDGTGTLLSSLKYSVAGAGNLARSLDKNAELQIRLDRSDYTPGQRIDVNVVAPYLGAGLITIERDKVYAWSWFRADTNATVQSIVVPEGLEGTAYVNVSFLRAADSREIHASPLCYGVVPFTVSRERRTNKIELGLPAEVPGSKTLELRYSTARPGRIVLFGVDEGILQVANYSPPAPLDHFFRKRALEVGSLQILDLLLPEYSVIRQLSAMGGDDEGLGRNLNPFKRKNKPPVAFWSGIIEADSTTRSYTYRVPDWFNGTIRVFAVSVSDDYIGTAEGSVLARNDFVITPNVPVALGPGDEFEVGVSMMDNLRTAPGAGPVDLNLALEASPGFELLGDRKVTAALRRGEERTWFFKLKVRDSPGEGSLRFTASGAGASSSVEERVSIRPFMPYRVSLSSGRLLKETRELALARKMIPEFRSLKAVSSYLPLALSSGLRDYLDKFPYGCTEQILSRAFPALALSGLPDLGTGGKDALDSFVQAQRVIVARQDSGGRVGLWSSRDEGSAFVTAYALHFLTEAKEARLPVDQGILSAGLDALKGIASGEGKVRPDPGSTAYAIYVLTRNGIITTTYINSLLGRDDLPKDWRSGQVAAYLSGAYALLKQEAEGARLLKSAFEGRRKQGGDFYDPLAVSGWCLYVASRHLPGSAAGVAAQALDAVSQSVADSEFNTLSASFAVLGLSAYAKQAASEAATDARVQFRDASGAWKALPTTGAAIRRGEIPYGSATVKFSETSGKPLYYQVVEAGFDQTLPTAAEQHGLEIVREYTDEAGKPIQSLALGDRIQVHIKLRSLGRSGGRVPNVAIVDLFPSGFELQSGEDGNPPGGGSLEPVFVEPREDRILVFCDAEGSAREYVYTLKSTAPGDFACPPAFAEAMYDRAVWALVPAPARLRVGAPGR